MNTYAEAIPAAEHERIYRFFWRGLYRSIKELANATGHAPETIKDLVERFPPSLLQTPECLTPEDRLRWCKQHRLCLVCAEPTERKNAHCCAVCATEWKYCPDCGIPQPLSLFHTPKEAYCKVHRNGRLAGGPTVRRRTPEEQQAEMAEIAQMRRDGKTWQQIATHYGCARPKTIQQRYTFWKKGSER